LHCIVFARGVGLRTVSGGYEYPPYVIGSQNKFMAQPR
jgi:hypothetical protein